MKTYIKLLMAAAALSLTTLSSYAGTSVYATTFPSGNPTLETVDLSTGVVSTLGTVNWGGTVNDIAADPITGTLYGLSGANLFTINTTTSVGSVSTISSTGMNGGMESLAFDKNGNLFIATQNSLYKFDLTSNSASYVGTYGGTTELGSTGQNIRFNGTNLYLTNTDADGHDSDMYSVDTTTGQATWIGAVVGHPGLALGNSGDHMYGSSVPAVQGSGSGTLDLLDFGTSVTTTIGANPDYTVGGTESATEALVDHTHVLLADSNGNGGFPNNVNFSAVPEPSTWMLLLAGTGAAALIRRRASK